MTEIGYESAPAPIRERIDAYMLDRVLQLPVRVASGLDAALTLTNGPRLRIRARSRHRRGRVAGSVDVRSLAVDVMIPDFEDQTWRTWFTVRFRGPYITELARMLTWTAPDDPRELSDPGV